jgi:hypothetical protein
MEIVTEEKRRRILDPAPDSALARARDYGMDLTLILEGVATPPEARIDRVVRMQSLVRLTDELRAGISRG